MHDRDLEAGSQVKNSYEENLISCNFGGIPLGTTGEPVSLTRIDDMEIDNLGFIHCDAQGSENFIFSSAIQMITKYKPVIFYENNYKFGKYLYEAVCVNYPQHTTESLFDLDDFCLNTLGYSRCLERFNGGIDTLLIP